MSKKKNTLTFQTNINLRMLKGFLTSAQILTVFFPRKFHHCFWRSKHDLIYHRQRIPWLTRTTFLAH